MAKDDECKQGRESSHVHDDKTNPREKQIPSLPQLSFYPNGAWNRDARFVTLPGI
jgi:hypothetical protein